MSMNQTETTAIERFLSRNWARFQDASMDGLKKPVRDSYAQALKEGRGLYLHGGVGTGKTWAMVAMFKDLAARGYDAVMWSSADIIHELKADFDKTEGRLDFQPYVTEMPVLLIDDIGSGRMTAWVSEQLFEIVNERNQNKLLTYFTSNHDPESLGRAMNRVYANDGGGLVETQDGDRLRSRISELCLIVNMSGKDRRMP